MNSPEAWGKSFPHTPVFDPHSLRNKKGRHKADLLLFLGGAEGDRTPDPKTASLVLSQLSYSPTISNNEADNVTSGAGDVKKKYRSLQALTVLRQWDKLLK